jgi:hypothetical protein
VRTRDEVGNVDASPAVRRWTVDTSKPSIGGLSPRPGFKTGDSTPRIQAVVKDSLAKLTKRNITPIVGDKEVSSFRYSPQAGRLDYTSKRLSYGQQTVRIIAKDAAGNRAVKSWRFHIVEKRR